jgi:hypothetical protein
VSQEVDLLELASLISSLDSLPPVSTAIDSSLSPYPYSADPISYINIINQLGFVPLSMEEQIFDTAF